MGDSNAQCSLGECYELGEGVKQDIAEAAKWYKKAAEQGDSDAQCHLGDLYYSDEGVSTTQARTRTGVQHGHVEAAKFEQDVAEAAVWYQKAAAQWNTIAIEALGRIAHVQDSG